MTERRDECYLITGALGCIGAWTVRCLLRDGVDVVAFDLAADPRRIRMITTPDEFAAVRLVSGDVTDLGAIERALDEHRITHVIHLAALQVPMCRADPPLGAMVNVVGTVNIFEAVRRRSEHIGRVVYASSIGMYDAADADPLTHRLEAGAVAHPHNHYGVYKLANEGTARVYWLENGISSIGLRPLVVYGPGRDQGLTSTPTKAIVAAVLGRPYRITFGGRTLFQYAEDAARTLIAASRSPLEGAHVFNLGGSLAHMREFIAGIEAAVPEAAGSIELDDDALPFPDEISDEGLAALGPIPTTPLTDGITASADLYRDLLARDALVAEEHGLGPSEAAVAR